jgi:hypothetical protein
LKSVVIDQRVVHIDERRSMRVTCNTPTQLHRRPLGGPRQVSINSTLRPGAGRQRAPPDCQKIVALPACAASPSPRLRAGFVDVAGELTGPCHPGLSHKPLGPLGQITTVGGLSQQIGDLT